MKKFLTTMLLCLTTIVSFAQLNVQTREEAYDYKVVYTCKMNYGDIRYSFRDHKYYFCGVTDNNFEKRCATIFLGNDKTSAIASLNDLENLKNTIKSKDEFVVNNAEGKPLTTIFRMQSTAAFKEEGVAGTSYALWKTDFEKARAAINDFAEE